MGRPYPSTVEAPSGYLLTPPASPNKARKTAEEYDGAIADYQAALRHTSPTTPR